MQTPTGEMCNVNRRVLLLLQDETVLEFHQNMRTDAKPRHPRWRKEKDTAK
jgi:hypothetical protein